MSVTSSLRAAVAAGILTLATLTWAALVPTPHRVVHDSVLGLL